MLPQFLGDIVAIGHYSGPTFDMKFAVQFTTPIRRLAVPLKLRTDVVNKTQFVMEAIVTIRKFVKLALFCKRFLVCSH